MTNIHYTTDDVGYLLNFVIDGYGEIPDAKVATIEDFNRDYASCYRDVDGLLIWDEAKYQEMINPTPVELQPTQDDFLLDLELRMTMLELGLTL